MEFKRDNREDIFTPKKRLEELLDENKEDKTDLIVAKKKTGRKIKLFLYIWSK